jgi:hypothetical protein
MKVQTILGSDSQCEGHRIRNRIADQSDVRTKTLHSFLATPRQELCFQQLIHGSTMTFPPDETLISVVFSREQEGVVL